MRIFSKSALRDFYTKHADSKLGLLTWHKIAFKSEWRNFQDIKNMFNSVDCIRDDLHVFNIKGNNYRLVVKIKFKKQMIFIKYIGTHSDYSKQKF